MYAEGVYLGEFEVTSGRIRVSDPCYNKDTWCAGVLDVPNGTWGAFVMMSNTSWGERVASINIFKMVNANKAHNWSMTNIDVGVDSGQAGFFDDSRYPEDPHEDHEFYDTVCDITLSKDKAGIVAMKDPHQNLNNKPFGAVSSSGYGDGGYSCYVSYIDGEIVAAKIVFIDEGYEEDDECEEE